MKNKITAFILVGTIAFSLCACGSREPDKIEKNTDIVNPEKTDDTENVANINDTEPEVFSEKDSVEEKGESPEPEESSDEEELFPFHNLKNIEFMFSSGVGAWATTVMIREDGSFYGEYYDSDMGDVGEGYPNGTMYRCDFTGRFTQPVKVNDYTYSMQICEINYAREAGTEEIRDGIRYFYTDAYGLDDAKDFLIYLPGTPFAELPEEFMRWVNNYSDTAQEAGLTYYALNNEVRQYGFAGYDVVENLREIISSTEEHAALLENSISNDPLTQTEYNEKTYELYQSWDFTLNAVWNTLKRVKNEQAMNALTAEQREWIDLKEQAAAEAGAAYEGGTMQEMVRNQKAAEMTKARVYELMERFD